MHDLLKLFGLLVIFGMGFYVGCFTTESRFERRRIDQRDREEEAERQKRRAADEEYRSVYPNGPVANPAYVPGGGPGDRALRDISGPPGAG